MCAGVGLIDRLGAENLLMLSSALSWLLPFIGVLVPFGTAEGAIVFRRWSTAC